MQKNFKQELINIELTMNQALMLLMNGELGLQLNKKLILKKLIYYFLEDFLITLIVILESIYQDGDSITKIFGISLIQDNY